VSDIATIPPLSVGKHSSINEGACVMEAVAFVAGEPWSDHPQCACPVIGTFLRSWNDSLPDAERDTLLRPFITKLVGTRATPEIELRRSLMCADWLIRTHTPAWLRLAKLEAQAASLESLPEIIAMAQVPSLRGPIEAVRKDADAAWDAAEAAAWDAARDAAGDAARSAAEAAAWDAVWYAARSAAGDAARSAAGDAAWYAAWYAARSAAGDAAGDAAWYAARSAAGDAAGDALKPTRDHLQQSALMLVERMISCGEAPCSSPV
jgi:hypothetical protein